MNLKKIFVMLCAAVFCLGMLGCGNDAANSGKAAEKSVQEKNTAKAAPAPAESKQGGKKILIAYFSHTQHTADFAKEIQKNVGGDLFAIEPVDAYPTDYDTVVAQAKEEINNSYEPKLKQDIDTAEYDVVFIGTPVWWSTFAPPVRTFLRAHDLSGKVVVPFVTHKGSNLSGMGDKIRALQPQADIKGGMAVWDDQAKSKAADIKAWLDGLKL
jgi:flavodoxin